MLATLTAHTAAYWGLAQLNSRALRGACCFGAALGLGFLASGLAPMLPLLPVAAFAAWRAENRQRALLMLLGALLLACTLAGAWLAALLLGSPDLLAVFWQDQLTLLRWRRPATAQSAAPFRFAAVVRMASSAARRMDAVGETSAIARTSIGLANSRFFDDPAGDHHLSWHAQRDGLVAAAAAGSARRPGRHIAAPRCSKRLSTGST
jgi:4-amino-4-deoxy-L-arabinose transferase-like glycosyltransferase